MAKFFALMLFIGIAAEGYVVKGIPSFRMTSYRSKSMDPKDNIPEIEVVFENGVRQRMILTHYDPIPNSDLMDKSQDCNYLGHLAGDDATSVVAVTGCLHGVDVDEKMHITLLSQNSPLHTAFTLDKKGTVELIETRSDDKIYKYIDDDAISITNVRTSPDEEKSSERKRYKTDVIINNDLEAADSRTSASQTSTVPHALTISLRLGYDRGVKEWFDDRPEENVDTWLKNVMTHVQARFMDSSLQHKIIFQDTKPTLFLDKTLTLDEYNIGIAETFAEVRRLNEQDVDLYAWFCDDFRSNYGGIAKLGGACDNIWYEKSSLTQGPHRDVIETALTLVHEMGHNLGMYHDFVDAEDVAAYDGDCRKHSDSLVIDCRRCANYQAGDWGQPIGNLTGDPNDCCNGFMGYGNHPNYWSDCSVRDFRESYISLNWDRCMDATSGSTTGPVVPSTTTPTISGSQWKEIGEGACLDVAGSYFNGLMNNFERTCQYDLDECKDLCQKMGKPCVGIEFYYSHDNLNACRLLVANGVSEEDALKLVPNFCSDRPLNVFFHNTIGGVVKSDGFTQPNGACWSHYSYE